MSEKKGLYPKYQVSKTDGTPIDDNAVYFVLRVDKDPHAPSTLNHYTNLVRLDNPKLAHDLDEMFTRMCMETMQKEKPSPQSSEKVLDREKLLAHMAMKAAELRNLTNAHKTITDTITANPNATIKEIGRYTWEIRDEAGALLGVVSL